MNESDVVVAEAYSIHSSIKNIHTHTEIFTFFKTYTAAKAFFLLFNKGSYKNNMIYFILFRTLQIWKENPDKPSLVVCQQ